MTRAPGDQTSAVSGAGRSGRSEPDAERQNYTYVFYCIVQEDLQE